MATSLIWFISFFVYASCQKITSKESSNEDQGICTEIRCTRLQDLQQLEKCIVVVGSVQINLFERTNYSHFQSLQFPLREITGYLVIYRVRGLESIGQIFPNLTRIRGQKLVDNYGLIVYDVPYLREIGLYNLVKIDRGGVIVWSVPHACYVDSIKWKTIAPRARHVIDRSERQVQCNFACRCSRNTSLNYCWNYKKCQIFLDDPESDVKCHDECLGCRRNGPTECMLCRHFTMDGHCLRKCPENTLVLPNNNYCVTEMLCDDLGGWKWEGKCVLECPVGYVADNTTNGITCKSDTEKKTCGSQIIQTIASIQAAKICKYINGSLTIHVRASPEAMDELRTYLYRIEEVTDYIDIYGSLTITSLDFLSSLRKIHGRTLKFNKYSLLVYDMTNLNSLMPSNVTEQLEVKRGTIKMFGNPVLCMSHIEKLKVRFPVQPNNEDVFEGMNGYSGGCDEVPVHITINVINEYTAEVSFEVVDSDAEYTVLYVRLPHGGHATVVPETCSESEWNVINCPAPTNKHVIVNLTSLRPASDYAFCVEIYDPKHKRLSRSAILNFTTHVGKPEPPFFVELVASHSDVVVLRWVDHIDYHPYIKYYELDVALIDIHDRDVGLIDHCKYTENFPEIDYYRHAVVMRPPPEYLTGCESMCGVLSSVTVGAMVEEYFDICGGIEVGCNNNEDIISSNTTTENYVRTLVLNISSPKDVFQVGRLAPYRGYRFRLRACTNNKCSRSARGVVKTLLLENADIPVLIFFEARTSGLVTVVWSPPEVTNGPILAYTIEVLPKLSSSDIPQVWCVSANETSFKIKLLKAKRYSVRVCSRTLGSNAACTEFKSVNAVEINSLSLWSAVIFGVLLYFASAVAGYFWKSRRPRQDLAPLVDISSTYRNESDPPISMLSDLVTFYQIPLRDTELH